MTSLTITLVCLIIVFTSLAYQTHRYCKLHKQAQRYGSYVFDKWFYQRQSEPRIMTFEAFQETEDERGRYIGYLTFEQE